MAMHTISEAALLSGKSRSTLYEYEKAGKLSVDRSDPKNPRIDTAELHRVFGELHNPVDPTLELVQLRTEVSGLRQTVDVLQRLVDAREQQCNDWKHLYETNSGKLSQYEQRLLSSPVADKPGNVFQRLAMALR